MPNAPKPDVVKLGLVQMRMSADPDANVAAATAAIRDLAARGARIVCLPELFRSPYFCQTHDLAMFDLAEPLDGPTTRAFAALAKELGVVIVNSIFERRLPGLYHNTAVVLDADGTNLGFYRKSHIPDDPRYHEKYYFAPGDTGVKVFDTRYARLGVVICWDQWYPESGRLAALQGAQILVIPTAIGWLPEDKPEWEHKHVNAWHTVQAAHAVANGMFVGVVNRVGHEPTPGPGQGIEFWGNSFVADPSGWDLVRGGTGPENLLAECDLAKQAQTRQNWPFLRDRRIDLYGGLLQRAMDRGQP